MSALASHAVHGSPISEAAARSKLNGKPHATIDFETRSQAELRKTGGFRYAQDDSTEILCLAYKLPTAETVSLWHPWLESDPDDLLEWVAAGGIVEAHNAEFEYAIWNYVCTPRFQWPRLTAKQLRCSAAKAAALALPRSLEELGNALQLDVQKDMSGRRLMLKMSKPRKATKKDSSPWHENFEDLDALFQYCTTDVVTEEKASAKIYPLIKKEQASWELMLNVNERGIYCDVELCKTAIEFATRYQADLTEELRELTAGEVQTAKQTGKLLTWLWKQGQILPNTQAATIDKALKGEFAQATANDAGRRVLEIRAALGKSSISKYQAMVSMAGRDQRIRGTMLYHGASTGRVAGRGIQPQNFPRGKIKDTHNIYDALKFGDYEFFTSLFPDVFTALSSALRGMLKAAPGNTLYAADYSAIEARVLLWLAGDEENLSVYFKGDDPYKHMAALIYSVPYSQVTKEQRELGKRAVLGCGFGMGKDKFHITCETQGFPIPFDLAERAVIAYREKYHMVKAYWYELEAAAKRAINSPGRMIEFKNLSFFYRGGYLFCELPSGRRLAYASPKIVSTEKEWGVRDEIRFMAVNSTTKKWNREATYGGKLTENIVQATARDVMNDAMLRVESKGYSVILSVHDEVVSETPKDFGSLDEFLELMKQVPNWAAGMPIAVEGWTGERYRK